MNDIFAVETRAHVIMHATRGRHRARHTRHRERKTHTRHRTRDTSSRAHATTRARGDVLPGGDGDGLSGGDGDGGHGHTLAHAQAAHATHEQSRGLATPRQAQREAQTRGLPRERWRRARGNKASQAAASSAGCTPGRLAQSCERHALVRGVGLRPGAAAVTFLRARNGGGEAAERVERDAEVEAAPVHDRERAWR